MIFATNANLLRQASHSTPALALLIMSACCKSTLCARALKACAAQCTLRARPRAAHPPRPTRLPECQRCASSSGQGLPHFGQLTANALRNRVPLRMGLWLKITLVLITYLH
jgi:hypothetical protein